jgi:hypothetical protein
MNKKSKYKIIYWKKGHIKKAKGDIEITDDSWFKFLSSQNLEK